MNDVSAPDLETRSAPYLDTPFAPAEVLVETRPDGSRRLRSPIPYLADEGRIFDDLPCWAVEAPGRIYLGERDRDGGWRTLTYAQAWRKVQGLGQALIDLGLGVGDPIAILSGNSIDHALLMLAGMSIGAVVAPISPNYSLLEGGLPRLAEVIDVLNPKLVYARAAEPFGRALSIPSLAGLPLITSAGDGCSLPLARLSETAPDQAFFAALAAVTPDMVAKVLFTSGSTGTPKGVLNTHRMLNSVLGMIWSLTPPTRPPVQLEWLPWHHTMGGNATFNSVLRAGGSLYIDEGRPTPQLFARTIANIREISPTSLLSVPAGFAMLAEALEADADLGEKFFARLERMTFGGAAIPTAVLDRLQAQAVRAIGKRVPITSGYGLTETAPTVSITYWPSETSGEIGLPIPGLELKLCPAGAEYELRVKGPSVTPGYLNRPDLTAAAFDEEGFYRTGDTVDFMDRNDPNRGLRFVGRLSENFKMATGTWVTVGELRTALLNVTGGLLQDVVLAGENQDALGFLGWLSRAAADTLLGAAATALSDEDLTRHPTVVEAITHALRRHNAVSGASGRVASFKLLSEAPSLGHGEITDKAYINQRAVLRRRSEQVAALWLRPPPPGVAVVF